MERAFTPVRLMILREVNSRKAQPGEFFKLRVEEPVDVNWAPVIPVGSIAWGNIVSVKQNGVVGQGGRLAAKLLYVELTHAYVHGAAGSLLAHQMGTVGFLARELLPLIPRIIDEATINGKGP